jgi:electron transport complex protein RnfC
MPELHHFHGGMKLPGHKAESLVRDLQQASLPAQLLLPLKQHIGDYNRPLVDIGDHVYKGQTIAASSAPISASVHAPTSGTISAIGKFPVAHPSGQPDTCIVIDVDGADAAAAPDLPDLQQVDAQQMLELICRAGIVGLGGAALSTALNANPISPATIC